MTLIIYTGKKRAKKDFQLFRFRSHSLWLFVVFLCVCVFNSVKPLRGAQLASIPEPSRAGRHTGWKRKCVRACGSVKMVSDFSIGIDAACGRRWTSALNVHFVSMIGRRHFNPILNNCSRHERERERQKERHRTNLSRSTLSSLSRLIVKRDSIKCFSFIEFPFFGRFEFHARQLVFLALSLTFTSFLTRTAFYALLLCFIHLPWYYLQSVFSWWIVVWLWFWSYVLQCCPIALALANLPLLQSHNESLLFTDKISARNVIKHKCQLGYPVKDKV